jgi:hypothetical protein
MNWQSVIEKLGQIQLHEGVERDPFMHLAYLSGIEQVRSARVSMTVARAIEYGEIKCSATISIDCPQKEAYIDLASEVAFKKALELVNDGMTQFGLPRIGE